MILSSSISDENYEFAARVKDEIKKKLMEIIRFLVGLSL